MRETELVYGRLRLRAGQRAAVEGPALSFVTARWPSRGACYSPRSSLHLTLCAGDAAPFSPLLLFSPTEALAL